jgi:hypothetical protein
MSTIVTGLFRPGVDTPARSGVIALAALRITVGLLWLYNVSWKRPPDFGRSSNDGLYGFTKAAVDHPVFPPYSWVVEHLVLPQFTAFGWIVLAVETALAVLLLTGTLVRLAALIGCGQSLAIALSVAQAPNEWPWSYWMMIAIHVVLFFSASGRFAAVDRARAEAAQGRGAAAVVPLVLGWGVVFGLSGLVAFILTVGNDPLASSGANLGGSGFSVSVGTYNLLGAVVLLAVAALMLAGGALHKRALVLAAAVVAGLAAVSLYAQLSRTDVWLGGSNTSAAFFLCAALVSGFGTVCLSRSKRDHTTVRAPGYS